MATIRLQVRREGTLLPVLIDREIDEDVLRLIQMVLEAAERVDAAIEQE
jgi:hypothetical protein